MQFNLITVNSVTYVYKKIIFILTQHVVQEQSSYFQCYKITAVKCWEQVFYNTENVDKM